MGIVERFGKIMSEFFTVNSEQTYTAFCSHVRKLFDAHKYITYAAPRIGVDRSIDQNSLFHLWLAEYAAHLLNKDKKQVVAGEIDGMKRTVKGNYYRTYHHPFMIHDVVCPKTGRRKKDYTSSASWKQGEMFAVLNYMQMMAAHDGLVLESKGEHARLKRQEVA